MYIIITYDVDIVDIDIVVRIPEFGRTINLIIFHDYQIYKKKIVFLIYFILIPLLIPLYVVDQFHSCIQMAK